MPPPRPRIRPPPSSSSSTISNTNTPSQTAITLIPPTNTQLRLNLHVKPNASQGRIISVNPENITISISEAARDGEANVGVVAFIAEVLGARKSDMQLISGFKSRDKVVRVEVEGLKWFGRARGKEKEDLKEVGVVEMVLRRLRERVDGEEEGG